jgi:hypothetical protein
VFDASCLPGALGICLSAWQSHERTVLIVGTEVSVQLIVNSLTENMVSLLAVPLFRAHLKIANAWVKEGDGGKGQSGMISLILSAR